MRSLRWLVVFGACFGILGFRGLARDDPSHATTITWRYAETPGFEILSNRPDEVTQQWVAGLQRQIQLFTHFLTDEFIQRTDVPVAIILYSAETDALRGRAMPGRNADPQPILSGGKITGFNFGSDRRSGGILRLEDMDALMFSPNLRDEEIMERLLDSGPRRITRGGVFREYAAHMMRYHTPPLPTWLALALRDLAENASFGWNELQFRDTTRQLSASTPFAPGLLSPMGEFLEADSPTTLGMAQGRLFFRWGMLADEGAHHAAFRKFIRRATREPVTEGMFQECFGINFAQMHEQLGAYLQIDTSRRPGPLSIDGLSDPVPLQFRDATAAEFARISGEATRLYALRPARPIPAGEAPDYYHVEALNTLMHAYDTGDRDPRLLASLGLCECDAGQPEKGRAFLEEAAKAQVVRPRVYLELARLRQREALADPKGGNRTLTPDQVATVLGPLAIARQQTPHFPQIYELIAETWLASEAAPAKADFAALEEGLSLYPRDSGLGYKTAQLYARSSLNAGARRIIESSLSFDPSAEATARLEKLKTELDAR